jgi:AraC-like DNA-binding protein
MEVLALPSIVAVRGPVNDNITHRHHALQIVVELQGSLELEVDSNLQTGRVTAVAPNVSHRLDVSKGLLILLEPESHLAVDFCERWLEGNSFVDLTHVYSERMYLAIKDAPLTKETLSEFLSVMSPINCFHKHIEPRVEKVIDWIDNVAVSGSWNDVSLGGALDIACLSESRFLHLFSDQIGIPWRRYILWRRLLGAVAHAAMGHPLTEGAHYAAFADAAHFSKTFKAMFGLSPAAVIKNSRFIQAS